MSGATTRSKPATLRDFHEEERLGRAYDVHLLRRLWPFMRPHSKYLWASLAMVLGSAVLNLARPVVMAGVVDAAQRVMRGG